MQCLLLQPLLPPAASPVHCYEHLCALPRLYQCLICLHTLPRVYALRAVYCISCTSRAKETISWLVWCCTPWEGCATVWEAKAAQAKTDLGFFVHVSAPDIFKSVAFLQHPCCRVKGPSFCDVPCQLSGAMLEKRTVTEPSRLCICSPCEGTLIEMTFLGGF